MGHDDLTNEFQCRINFSSNRRGEDTNIFRMVVEEKDYAIATTRPRFRYKPYQGESDNPIEDKKFLGVLDDAIDEAMGFVVDEATAK